MKAPVRILFLLALTSTSCSSSSSSPRDELRQLEKADSFELYSLEPLNPETGEQDFDRNDSSERLHGWRILGKTTVSEETPRRELIDALKKSMNEKGRGNKCFQPRHAIRRTGGGKSFDLLICFECGNTLLYRDGNRVGDYEFIGDGAESTLDEALKMAGIPLAKKKPKRKD